MSIIIDGVWRDHQEVVDATAHQVTGSNEIERIVATIGEIVVRARDMSDADHRRVCCFLQAAGDLMVSRDRLKTEDRAKFENALRDAVARRHGF
jgi:hypothetical protein